MSDHLPECFADDTQPLGCICDRLRAAQHRRLMAYIESDAAKNVADAFRAEGYDAGLKAARDAVAALLEREQDEMSSDAIEWVGDAIAAIDEVQPRDGRDYSGEE